MVLLLRGQVQAQPTAQFLKGENMASIYYKTFNPATGEYIDAQTKEDCMKNLAQIAYDFYLTHAHCNPYTVVEVDKNNVEIWRNPQGEEILSTEQIKKYFVEQSSVAASQTIE